MFSLIRKFVSKLGPSQEERLRRILNTDDSFARWTDPVELVSARRFDLGAKLIYARLRERGVDIPWTEFAYRHHLQVWGNFIEESPPKNSYAQYKQAYDEILDVTKTCKGRGLISLIPLSKDGYALNGAHRISAAITHRREVLTTRIDMPKTFCNFDYRFFRWGAEEAGIHCDEAWDAMALVMCETMPNGFMITRFPAGNGRDERIDEILSRYGEIVYERAVDFTEAGKLNLIRAIYEGESWVGSLDDNFYHARNKARDVFLDGSQAHFILFNAKPGVDLAEAKQTIRDLFQRGKNSIHINDRREEAVRIARAVFNANSRHFLNYAQLALFETFEELFASYSSATTATNDPERFCISGSAVLACYGMRDCRDLDYLHTGKSLVLSDEISSHNDHIGNHIDASPAEVVFDPRKHFYYRGMKFASLGVVRALKAARREAKDEADIAAIDRLGPLPVPERAAVG